MSDLSFYSKEHGGTFHFLQFNVLNRGDFLASPEFQHFIKFIEYKYPKKQRKSLADDMWSKVQHMVEKISLKKNVIDMHSNKMFNA